MSHPVRPRTVRINRARTASAAFVVLLFLYLYSMLGAAGERPFDWIAHAVLPLFTATLAWLSAWYALRGHRRTSRIRIRTVLRWGGGIGGVAFAVGFLGPILLSPQSPRGPLLGLFFTGPVGFMLGVIAGLTQARRR